MTLTPTERLTTVPVSEVYGPVFQGEGLHAGRVCWFLRLGLCNLRCSWCDTAYTWDEDRYDVHAECPPRTGTELANMLPATGLLVLSGGEPLIHQDNPALRGALETTRAEVHVETNGTLVPSEWAAERVEHFTVSPKIADQGDPEHRRLRAPAIGAFTELAWLGRAAFKAVVRDVAELELVAGFYDRWDLPARARWVMPEGVDRDTILHRAHQLAPRAAELGLNLSLRQHVLLYGNERLR